MLASWQSEDPSFLTGSVAVSVISGNNYTGKGEASSSGILVYGGGASCSGGDPQSGLVRNAGLVGNRLVNNDVGIALFNVNTKCTKSAPTPTRDVACFNTISNSHGYPDGVPSADANISGLVTTSGSVGDQAGVSDTGNRDVICANKISGAGYSPLGTGQLAAESACAGVGPPGQRLLVCGCHPPAGDRQPLRREVLQPVNSRDGRTTGPAGDPAGRARVS